MGAGLLGASLCSTRLSSDLPFQDEVNQIMETNLWLKQVSEPARALLPPGGHYILCGSVSEQGQRLGFAPEAGMTSCDWLCCLLLGSRSLGPPMSPRKDSRARPSPSCHGAECSVEEDPSPWSRGSRSPPSSLPLHRNASFRRNQTLVLLSAAWEQGSGCPYSD